MNICMLAKIYLRFKKTTGGINFSLKLNRRLQMHDIYIKMLYFKPLNYCSYILQRCMADIIISTLLRFMIFLRFTFAAKQFIDNEL